VAAEISVYGELPLAQASIATLGLVNDGKWHHFVATLDGVNHRLYLDGVTQVAAVLVTNTALNTNLFIGGPTQSVLTFFDGAIDDVRIYNRALSEQEVTQLYSMGE
jgi:sialidase-1